MFNTMQCLGTDTYLILQNYVSGIFMTRKSTKKHYYASPSKSCLDKIAISNKTYICFVFCYLIIFFVFICGITKQLGDQALVGNFGKTLFPSDE